MRYYYTDAANQPVGPCEMQQLQALAAEGKINDSTSVIPEGAQVWTTYGAVKPGGVPPAPRPPPGPPLDLGKMATIMGDTVALLLKLASGLLTPAFLRGTLAFSVRFGHFAVILGAVLGLIAGLVEAIRFNSTSSFFLGGVVFVIAVAVAQYSAQRFTNAGAGLIAASPTRLSSKAFPDCVAVFDLLGALAVLLGGIYIAIRSDTFSLVIPAVVVSFILTCFGVIALNPEEVNVTMEPGAGAGEEAIAIFSFFTKAWLKLAPLLFFVITTVGVLGIVFSFSDRGKAMASEMMASMGLGVLPVGVIGTSAGTVVVLFGCLIPVLSYLGFLLSFLVIDLLRAQLSIPGKLDALKKH